MAAQLPLFSRREFLVSAAASLAVGGVSSTAFGNLLSVTGAGQETILLTDKDVPGASVDFNAPHAFPMVTPPGSIKAFNTATGEMSKIDVPFFGHTTVQDTRHPHRVVSFDKWGRKGALVDLKTKSVLANTEAEPGYMFFGHAAYIRNGSVLVVPEDSYDATGGKLMLRNPDTLVTTESVTSYGSGPHQCMLLDDGKTLLVANGGNPRLKTPSNIVWIDTDTWRLVKSVTMDIEPCGVYGHVDVSYDGWVGTCGFVTTPSHDYIYARAALISPEGKVIKLDIPDGIPSEVLSLSFLGRSGLMAATMPDVNQVYIWNYHDQSLVGKLLVHKPRGILPGLKPGDQTVLVSIAAQHNKHMKEFTIDAQKNFPYRRVDAGFGGLGAHLLRAYI